MPASFFHYRLTADTLCLGERTRGGTFRPCASVFSYPTLVGALKEALDITDPLHASARFVQEPRREVLTFAPRDRARGVSSIPLQVEYLVDARADLYILQSDSMGGLHDSFSFTIGALRSKGLGRCLAERLPDHTCDSPSRRPGRLCLRLPDPNLDPQIKAAFGIGGITAARYGYLFKLSSPTSGNYLRSLFEGSKLHCYDVILDPER
jgi:hypothetical protein